MKVHSPKVFVNIGHEHKNTHDIPSTTQVLHPGSHNSYSQRAEVSIKFIVETLYQARKSRGGSSRGLRGRE